MYISEAVKKSLETNGVIYRESAQRSHTEIRTVIKPTSTYNTCLLIVCRNNRAERSAANWNPTADDLIANDWNVLRDEF